VPIALPISPLNWNQARRLFRRERAQRDGSLRSVADNATGAWPIGGVRAASLCVASGKGGVGKSVLAASISAYCAMRGRTLLIDADLGMGNAHILQGVQPEASLVDFIERGHTIGDIRTPCNDGLDLLAGGSGIPHMAGLRREDRARLSEQLAELEVSYKFLVLDSAAGISSQTMAFAAAADRLLLVLTPDVTSMTDAYGFLKVHNQVRPAGEALFVVNRAIDEEQAYHTADRFREVSERFLGVQPRWLGFLPEDPEVGSSVNRRKPLLIDNPGSPAGRALTGIGAQLFSELECLCPRGLGRSLSAVGGGEPLPSRISDPGHV